MIIIVEGMLEAEFINMLLGSLREDNATKLREIVTDRYKEWYRTSWEDIKEVLLERIEKYIVKFSKARVEEISPIFD